MTEKSNEEEGARRTKGQQGGRSHKDSEKLKNLEKKGSRKILTSSAVPSAILVSLTLNNC